MKRGKRTPLFEILGETNEFPEFEALIQKCLHPTREFRPENMMIVKNKEIFADFVNRIQEGELPSDIMATPAQIIKNLREENEQKDRKIQVFENIVENLILTYASQRLKEEIEGKDGTIRQLNDRLDTFNEILEYRLGEEAKEKEEKIAEQNRVNF